MEKNELNQISEQIISAAIEVHKHLGPGLLESVYEKILSYELRNRGLEVKTEEWIDVKYKELEIKKAYRIDILVNNLIIIEITTIENILPIHEAQLGLLINFHEEKLVSGIKRYINPLLFPKEQ